MNPSEDEQSEKPDEQSEKPVAASAGPKETESTTQQDKQDKRPEDPKNADDVLTRRVLGTEAADAEVLARSRKQTRRSFVVAAAGAAAAYGFYHWLEHGPQNDMQPDALRRAFEFNAGVSRHALPEHALAPTYPLERAETLRINGIYGLKKALEPDSYRLQVVGARNAEAHPRFTPDVTAWEYKYSAQKPAEDQGHDTKVPPGQGAAGQAGSAKSPANPQGGSGQAPAQDGEAKQGSPMDSSSKMAPHGMMAQCVEDENHTGRKPRGKEEAGESYSTLKPGTPGLLLTLEDVLQLPRYELVTQFKCIEGWSQIVHWAGVRFADFLEAYPPAWIDGKEPRYIYMETPDGDYYVGYELHACRHPQMLLVTEMMGMPLTQNHGAPLRLHTPTRYGYKQIKRIALISYTNEKPDDYWTELGYDGYAGL